MRFDRFGTAIAVVALTALPALAGDDPRTLRARLTEIETAQKALSQRYSSELQKAAGSKEAQDAAVARFLGELSRTAE